MKFIGVLFTALILLAEFTYSQTDWNITGQLQLRSELDGRDFSNETHPLTFTSLRTRLGVEKGFGDLNFFVQIQDSRVFGEENNTLANFRNLDLHQGYVQLSNIFSTPLSLQAGRFELVYGTERFFGAVGWHYVGRSWDGGRLKLRPGFNLDIFALTQSENQPYIANALPALYPDPAVPVVSSSIYGFWASFYPVKEHQIDPFYYYDVNRAKVNNELAVSRHTAGLNYFYKGSSFNTIFEGAYQFGSLDTSDIGAYLLSLQIMYTPSDWKLGAGADILSGTDPEGDKIGTFNPAYGTNHKFYGFMDYFINIPSNTNSLGLQDFYFTTGINPSNSKFGANLWIHHFTSNQELVDESTFGQEIDLILSYTHIKGTTLSLGGSLFLPGELMKTKFRTVNGVREDTAFWTYLMISANL
jgi:hypothetical protein